MADFVDIFLSKAPPLVVSDDAMDYADVFAPQLRDLQKPTITVVSPALGQPIPRNVAFVVDVTDDETVGSVLYAEFEASRLSELIWKGDRFTFRYAKLSTRTPITGGWRYSLRREGGWPSAPTFGVVAWDGNARI